MRPCFHEKKANLRQSQVIWMRQNSWRNPMKLRYRPRMKYLRPFRRQKQSAWLRKLPKRQRARKRKKSRHSRPQMPGMLPVETQQRILPAAAITVLPRMEIIMLLPAILRAEAVPARHREAEALLRRRPVHLYGRFRHPE